MQFVQHKGGIINNLEAFELRVEHRQSEKKHNQEHQHLTLDKQLVLY